MKNTQTQSAAQQTYLRYINEILPSEIKKPVRLNHCFARIILDWLFRDVWYNHIKTRPAYAALNEKQLVKAVERMEKWRSDNALLVADNQDSLRYRGKLK